MIKKFLTYCKETPNHFWAVEVEFEQEANSFPYCRLAKDNPEYYKDLGE